MQMSDRIGRRMKLQDLHVLLSVVQTGSMVKAAKLLNSAQPAISRSIADLEQALGVRLLDRKRHGVEPTEYGRVLLDCGVAAFDELRQGVKNVEFLADPTAGEIRIGCNTLLAASFVSAVVDRLSRHHPRMVFHLVTDQGERLHRELSERNVELLIVRKYGPIADAKLEFEFLYEDSYVIVADKKNPWVRRRRIALADLVGEPWVLRSSDTTMGAVVMEAFRVSGLDHPRVSVVTNSPEVRMSLLATGRFLTIVPTSTLRSLAKHSNIKVVPVELPIARVPNGIVTLKNRTLSPVARLFIEAAREVAKPLANRK